MRYQTLVFIQFTCAILLVLTGPIIASNPLLLLIEITAIGLGSWALSKNKIGNFNISPNVKRHSKLVVNGPYKFVRHPMYAALLLGTLALVFNKFSFIRLWIWITLSATVIIKLLIEERLLIKHFRRYASYQRHTKRLIPFIF